MTGDGMYDVKLGTRGRDWLDRHTLFNFSRQVSILDCKDSNLKTRKSQTTKDYDQISKTKLNF
jgi:hypothetical protein